MRERSIELIESIHEAVNSQKGNDYLKKIVDYLLENGAIVLPCKVGDILYVISQLKDKRILPFINKYEVTSILLKKKSIVVYHEMDGYIKIFKQTDFGKTVFLTQEDAEQALKEGVQ